MLGESIAQVNGLLNGNIEASLWHIGILDMFGTKLQVSLVTLAVMDIHTMAASNLELGTSSSNPIELANARPIHISSQLEG